MYYCICRHCTWSRIQFWSLIVDRSTWLSLPGKSKQTYQAMVVAKDKVGEDKPPDYYVTLLLLGFIMEIIIALIWNVLLLNRTSIKCPPHLSPATTILVCIYSLRFSWDLCFSFSMDSLAYFSCRGADKSWTKYNPAETKSNAKIQQQSLLFLKRCKTLSLFRDPPYSTLVDENE